MGSSPISSRKSVPLSASSNLPILRPVAPVKDPRSWPKSSDSRISAGIARAVDRQKACVLAGRVLVESVGDQFLAGPRIPDDEDVRSRGGHHLHLAEEALHRLGTADELAEFLPEAALQLDDLPRQQALFDDRGRALAQLEEVDRLGEVVVGAPLHRVDRGFHRAVPRDHEDPDVGIDLARGGEHAEAVGARHHEVGDHEDDVAVGTEIVQGGRRLREGRDRVPDLREGPLVGLAVASLVFDDDGVDRFAHARPVMVAAASLTLPPRRREVLPPRPAPRPGRRARAPWRAWSPPPPPR